VRKLDTHGIITTVAGNGGLKYSGDGGVATNASFSSVSGVAVDNFGNILIADTHDSVVRKVDVNGIITTVAGNGIAGYSGDGGPATNASMSSPVRVAVDAFGNLFISDAWSQVIRSVDSAGIINTVAGDGLWGYSGDGGIATNASLDYPGGLAFDGYGNLYFADFDNSRVRTVSIAGIPSLTLDNISSANVGNLSVTVTGAYGSVTSTVATLTLVPNSPTNGAIVMNPPLITGGSLILGFNSSQTTSSSFTLLQAQAITGPWTTNSAAVLTSNAQPRGFLFTLPVLGSTEFFQVRSP